MACLLCMGARGAVAVAVITACRSDSAPGRNADSALARDLALANVIATQPALADEPLADEPPGDGVRAPSPEPGGVMPGPVRPDVRRQPVTRPRDASDAAPRRSPVSSRPAPVRRDPDPPAPAPADSRPANAPASTTSESAAGEGSEGAGRGFAAGTRLALTTGSAVCTVSGRPGDKIIATLREPVRGTGGAMIPAGSVIVLEVASTEAGDPPETGRITFRVRALDVDDRSHPAHGGGTVSGGLAPSAVKRVNARDRRKVIGGAVVGAILGRAVEGSARGAVIGAAAGGAAGAASARSDRQVEGCLPARSPVTIVLEEGLSLAAGR